MENDKLISKIKAVLKESGRLDQDSLMAAVCLEDEAEFNKNLASCIKKHAVTAELINKDDKISDLSSDSFLYTLTEEGNDAVQNKKDIIRSRL